MTAAIDPVRVWQLVTTHFSLEDIRTTCFVLGIDYETLPGEGKGGKARELVMYCRNRAMLGPLVTRLQQDRPSLEWIASETAESAAEEAAAQSAEERLYHLVKEFNRNRHQPLSATRNRIADDIAFQMREMAPTLDGQLDVDAWLHSANIGKRVAAVEYLDWKQDTEYLGVLLDKLPGEQPFIQFHILIAFSSMLDQLPYEDMKILSERLMVYDAEGDSSRYLWQQDLLGRVAEWFRSVE